MQKYFLKAIFWLQCFAWGPARPQAESWSTTELAHSKNGAVFASKKFERWTSGATWHPVALSKQDKEARDCDGKWRRIKYRLLAAGLGKSRQV